MPPRNTLASGATFLNLCQAPLSIASTVMLPSDQIDDAVRQAVAAGDVPGAVAMAASGEGVIYAGAFGVRDLASGTAMTRDTVFRIA